MNLGATMLRIAVLFLLVFSVHTRTPVVAQQTTTLKVSLFPWVPSPKDIEQVVQNHWNRLHPDVSIEFVEWDCYGSDPPPDLDVFETDAIILDYFVQNGFVAQLTLNDIDAASDIYEFAIRGSAVDNSIYGIPRIACRPMLFYRCGDSAVRNAAGISELFRAIGASPDVSFMPPRCSGLFIDFSGGTTCACYYLDAVADISGDYQIDPDLPKPGDVQDAAIDNLQLLTLMAGSKQALFENYDGLRSRSFTHGNGRALVGFSERLAHMPEACHARIGIRSLPLAGKDRTNLMFVDTLCLNSELTGQKRQLALEFANLAASTAVVIDSFLVRNPLTNSPQYLLPVRKSVLIDARVNREAPMYQCLRPLLEDNPQPFRIGSEVRDWLATTKSHIQERVTTPSTD